MIRIEAESNNTTIEFSEDSNNSLDFSLILSIFSKKFFFIRPFDDVLNNSNWLSKLKISINEIWKIWEIKSKLELIFLEPFVLIVVLNLLKFSSCIGKQQSTELAQSSDFPIAKGHFIFHQRYV